MPRCPSSRICCKAEHSTFEDAVRAIYGAIFDTLTTDSGVIEALIAEVLAKPNGPVFDLAPTPT